MDRWKDAGEGIKKALKMQRERTGIFVHEAGRFFSLQKSQGGLRSVTNPIPGSLNGEEVNKQRNQEMLYRHDDIRGQGRDKSFEEG
jgi:hypothetical protein